MAIGGTPVGNMVIKVDLDSTGVEKSMTGLQRQLKSSNKAMGAQLSAFGRGEKSAAKYGVLIEGLTNRHRIQARMVEEARAKYQAMASQYGENSVKAQKASQELNEQIARYQETGRELDNVTAEFKEFQRVQDIQNKGWYKAADSMEQWGGKLKTAGAAMDNAGKNLTRNVTMPLGIVGGLAVKTGMDFESGMSRVGAVSGASAKDMQKLEAKAREMGATTVFSAKEASDAFYYMSLAGWDAADMMDGISGVMDLAAASGEDLASVSDIVTDGLTAFGKSAKESGRMADILAATSSKANTDVAGLGLAFQYVAPVAGALGYTMEDTSKAIGLMANAGIKGEKAGTALRTMMTNLAKPTKEMKKEMNKLGISLTDNKGNMKTFDQVMSDLRKGMGGLTKEQQASAAATIFGKEAMSGALAIINASEEDYKKLTDAIKNSDGAAADMAETMQDNLAGSLKSLRSMVEDLFIEMYKNLKPTLEAIVEKLKDATNWFAQLSPKTQENIVKFGLLAAAMGPVLSVTGKLTFGIGGLMQGAGALTKTIGLAKGVGTAGAIASLGPAGVTGLAIAGVAALAVGVYKLVQKSKEAEEVNLDVAKSLNNQATELENSANTFDKLSSKAKISNEQLAELNDLNIRISQSSNPGEIAELQKQYDNLAKKSGLSKDELKELFNANKNIIEQTPEVKTSVSEQGNAFVESTAAVRKYIEKLQEMSLTELKLERAKQLEKEKELSKQLATEKQKLNELDELSSRILNIQSMSKEEILARQKELNRKQWNNILSYKEKNELMQEQDALQAALDGKLGDEYEKHQKNLEAQRKKVDAKEEELQKVKAVDQETANHLLRMAGINEEGTKGLAQLDQSIAKNREELAQLEEKHRKNGDLTAEEHERYNKLSQTTQKQIEARNYLHDELGIYRDLNSLAQAKIEKLSQEKQQRIENLAKTTGIKVEEGNIVQQMQKKNEALLNERNNLEENRKKQGANKAEIDKQIAAIDKKILHNDGVIEAILRELGIWDQVKDSINKASSEVDKKNNKQKETNKELDKENQKHDQSKKKQQEKNSAIDQGTDKQKNQGNQIDNNNKKTDKGIQKEKERTKEAGKSVDKNVNAKDQGTVAKIDKKATAPKDKKVTAKDHGSVAKIDKQATTAKTKKVNLTAGSSLTTLNRLASSPVTKVVNFVGKGLSKLKFWAKGTPPQGHPGGAAVVGDGGGRELIKLPDGRSFLSPATDTLLNLPRGTHVIPHRETARLLKSVKHYANGTGDWESLFAFENVRNNEFMKLLALTSQSQKTEVEITSRNKNVDSESKTMDEFLNAILEQNQYLQRTNEILVQLLNKDPNVYMDTEKVGRAIEPTVTKQQQRKVNRGRRAPGFA